MKKLRDIIDDILSVKGNIEANSMYKEASILEKAVTDLEEMENELYKILHKMDKYVIHRGDESEEVELTLP